MSGSCFIVLVKYTFLLKAGRQNLNVASIFMDRGDSVGDDVIWGGAVCIRAASGGAESAGEG